ncbi:ribosome biogenesis GTP-binding protein YihA/YsxC [Candidatus Contubernalis alkaliaceticus]|uniref:ribosome biogenesis GTP-binding protein YihA/YsxC n=1 Tax=Candidatus Contubernalis alkaliaceticus TaxID=338645 RepID=UPI001F4C210B|nr:ribosome biogenesis GTP-binding protein YihA/YsxC [Candidatus Contubernalis alkalaceticus]UNC90895.1 YihA family ribosome biogenesis GTP-binding protein [Candidatus Contubernalis alkalaceticus]
MQVKSVEFCNKAVNPEQFPSGELPEVAFCGRSNVGKSSLVNSLLGRKRLAPTSSQPGKTRTIDFYVINGRFLLVDLPGYGFARVSKQMKERWRELIEGYLEKREQLKVVVMLMDIRHDPTEDDLLMYQWLKFNEIPTIVAATKSDKLSRGRALNNLKKAKKKLGLRGENGDIMISFSAKTGDGRIALWKTINELLENRS